MTSREELMRVGQDGTVVEWSRRAQELFGRPATQVLGQSAVAATAGVPAELQVHAQALADGSMVWVVREARDGADDELSAAVLEPLFTQSPLGLHVLDRRLRVVHVNPATQAMRQPTSEPINGQSLSEAYHFEDPEHQEAAFRRVLDSGAALLERLVRGSLGPGRERDRSFLVSAFRLQDCHDVALGLAAVVTDVTELEAGRRRAAILSHGRHRVGRTLDVVATCQELAEVLVPPFADIAVVDVAAAITQGEEPAPHASAVGVPLLCAASAGGQDFPNRAQGELRLLRGCTPCALSLADLRPRLVSVDDSSYWLDAEPALKEAMRNAGTHSILVVPLALRSTVLGLLSLFRCGTSLRFDQDDLALAVDLARHTTLCLDNARRYAREQAMAATVQRRLLPQRPIPHTGLDTACAYLLGRSTGGSWFDIVPLSSSRSLLVIGQVTGEGIHAAIAMGQLRTAVQALAALDLEADDLMARLNDTVLQLAEEHRALPTDDPAHGESLTAAYSYAVYDPVSRTCTAGCAGLPGPLLTKPDGTVSPMDVPDGPLLGSTDVTPFAATQLDINEGTILALATPVLLDAVSPERLRQLLSSHRGASMQELCDSIIYASCPSRTPEGDAILVLARSHTISPDRTTAWSLEADHSTPGSARALARGWLTKRHVPEEAIFAAEVIVSELLTNAIRYGTPPLNVRLILVDCTLTTEVSDASATSPHLRHARATDEDGRGLFIIAQLADRWGTRHTPEGKTIWAEMRTTANEQS
ncbi:SpoIIE family protein phosphatase [Streptomyces mirabilis]